MTYNVFSGTLNPTQSLSHTRAVQDAMMDFFNNQMNMAGMLSQTDGSAIISCQVNLDKNFAFLEVYLALMFRND